MLRLISGILLILFFVSVVAAQPIISVPNTPSATPSSKPVFCMVADIPYTIFFVKESFGAVPLFKVESSMYTNPAQIMMFGNHGNGMWVIIEFMEGSACVLGAGTSIIAQLPNKEL